MKNRNKHAREVKRAAKELGYEFVSGKKHYKFFHPATRRTVVTATTPSGCYGTVNAIKELVKSARRVSNEAHARS